MRAHIDLPGNRAAATGRGAGHRESWWPLAVDALVVALAIVLVVVAMP
jgi:hypothetical protein